MDDNDDIFELPIGSIYPNWMGKEEDIPEGWVKCDGRIVNGFETPNLSDQFHLEINIHNLELEYLLMGPIIKVGKMKDEEIDKIYLNNYCQYDLEICGKLKESQRCLEDKCSRWPGKTSALYFPELGQAVMGQEPQEYECPEYVCSALEALACIFEDGRVSEENPFRNTGWSWSNDIFEVNAYDWDEERKQPYNFKYKDIEVSWYKYLGRGMSVNREVTVDECTKMLVECLQSLLDTCLDGDD